MRYALYLALHAAIGFLGVAAVPRGLFLNYTDPAVLGGAQHNCYRECREDDIRVCYYEFTLVEWSTMSIHCGDCPYVEEDCYARGCLTAGGDTRPVVVANHMLPGPSIQVCEGDLIQVNLTNGHHTEGTAIHWHGMFQEETPYMDGVPFLTQCPILPGHTFLYEFVAHPAGTHIWHSHAGVQEADGLYGSLIVREAHDEAAKYYDYDLPEHVMLIWHWFNAPTAFVTQTSSFTGAILRGYSITINGYAATSTYTEDEVDYYTPRANFTVTQGYRYRFRSIANTAVSCPIQVSVDGHTLTMIATDGASFKPVKVDSFIINAGERYDFVLIADQPVGNYWIRYKGLGKCEPLQVSEVAVLHYEGAAKDEPVETTGYKDADRSGALLNPVAEASTKYPDNTLIRLSDLESSMNVKDTGVRNVSGTPDQTIYIKIRFKRFDGDVPGLHAQVHNISYTNPIVPLLTQYHEVTSDMYCTEDNMSAKKCFGELCTCPMIYKAALGNLVEIVIVDETVNAVTDHPMHFHGHFLRVVAQHHGNGSAITVDDVRALNDAGLIEKNVERGVLKDVIATPAGGFVVLRVIADCPGYWLFHCHVGFHYEEGMGGVIKVGEDSEMRHPPPDFPTCSGNYDQSKWWTHASTSSDQGEGDLPITNRKFSGKPFALF